MFCTNPPEVEVQLHATKKTHSRITWHAKSPTPPRMKVDRLTIDQDPQGLKMGNFLKPYKCLGLGISNYHQLIGVFHLTGCAPSIDPTWQAFQIPAKTPGILGGKRKFLVSHTHKFPWDWYFYLILWFIFMVNLRERYHSHMDCLGYTI